MVLGIEASQETPMNFDAFKQHHDSTDEKDRALYVIHAHTYFPYSTQAEQQKANEFLAAFKARFADKVGVKFDDINTRGGDTWPHPLPQFEAAFIKAHVADILPWLMFNRPDGFSVLLHPFTAQLVEDHTSRAVWLGPQLEIRLPLFVKMERQIALKVKEGKDEAALLWPFV